MMKSSVFGNGFFLVGLCAIVVCLVLLLIHSVNPGQTFAMVALSIFPLAISTLIAAILSRRSAQILNGVGIGAFLAWFLYIYFDAFHLNPDAMKRLGFLYLGVVSLPVMLPVWIVSLVLNRRRNPTNGAQ